MRLIDNIRAEVKKSGQSKSKFFYVREGEKARIRFLNDMNDGMEVAFHDSFAKSINVPCQEIFGRTCDYCEDEELRTRSQYVWSVYNYEAKEVQLFMFPVNNCTPIPALMSMYENYGTLTDRDYVVGVTGKQQNKTYSVVPMDKVKFRNEKAKALSEKTILKLIDKAFPADGVTDDEEEEKDTKRKPSKTLASKSKKEYVEEDEDWDEEEDAAADYSEMTPKELFNLCKERGIDVIPKKSAKYYINELEEYDAAQEDWGDEEDEWEDED